MNGVSLYEKESNLYVHINCNFAEKCYLITRLMDPSGMPYPVLLAYFRFLDLTGGSLGH